MTQPSPQQRRGDDAHMHRFDDDGLSRFSARTAIVAVVLTLLVATVLTGDSVRRQGERAEPGVVRDTLLIVGRPAGWVADKARVAEHFHDAVDALKDEDSRSATAAPSGGGGAVTPAAFDPGRLGEQPPKPRKLRRLLVTGDSMSMPLDVELARRLEPDGITVVRDPHVGTGLSNSAIADWSDIAREQVADERPDAVVVFVGANEGYPFDDGEGVIECCGTAWAAAYANRAQDVLGTWLGEDEETRVYWLSLPVQRDERRLPITTAVNEAVAVAASPWRAQVRLLDVADEFTPDDRYRDSIEIEGRRTLVRQADGIHLNEAGSRHAAGLVLDELERDFRLP